MPLNKVTETKDTKILSFLVENYPIKTDVKYYSLPNLTTLKLIK